MDTRSKTLIILFLALFCAVGIYKYREIVIERNFVVYAHVSCDSTVKSCFVADCDGSDTECDLTPYGKIEKIAKNIPECGPTDDCADLVCQEGEAGCKETHCSDETLEEGEICLVAVPDIETASTTTDDITE